MNPLLSAADLRFSYGVRPALSGVSLNLAAGEVVVLIGPNGSGKSTLLKVLLGDLRGTGRIEFNGKPLSKWRRKELAAMVAYLSQSPRFEPGQRVLDILRLGRAPFWGPFGLESPDDEKAIAQTAKLLSLEDLLDRPMDQLSGGQRQRALVGRCLAQGPSVLLLDEPGAFLDLKHQLELCKLLRELSRSRGLAVLMASHELNISGALSDRMILLNNGSIAAEGTPGEVLRPDILQRVYGVPIQRFEGPGGIPVVAPAI